MFRAGFKTIRLGLETTNFSKTRNHDGKVAEKEFYKLITENSISKLILEAQKNYEEKTVIPVFVEELDN